MAGMRLLKEITFDEVTTAPSPDQIMKNAEAKA